MKIIIPAIICVFLLINVVYSGTTTISGMYIEHNISTQTSAPDKTLYETANQQNNYINKVIDTTAKTVTYTGGLNAEYPFESYFKIYDKYALSTVKCTTTTSNNNCVISYASVPPADSTLVYIFYNEFDGPSTGQTTFYSAGLGEIETIVSGMYLTTQISFTSSPPDITIYEAANMQNNYINKVIDTTAKTVTYTGGLNAEYPFESYFKIYDKYALSTVKCTTTTSNNNCVISYASVPPADSTLVYIFYNEFDGPSSGQTTFYAGGLGPIETVVSGMYMTTQFVINEIVPPSYISPTPANGAKKYNIENFTVRINDSANIASNSIVKINNQNYTMTENSDIFEYTFTVSESADIQNFNFEVFYNSSGIMTSMGARTVSSYPSKSGSGGSAPFGAPIAAVISLLAIFAYLRGKKR